MTPNQDNPIDQADEPNLSDYWHVVWSGRKLILIIFLIAVIGVAIISLLMTPIYEAKATLMAVEPSANRFSAILGSLQNIPYLGGAVGGALGKTATDKLLAILKSRTIAEDVIEKLDLIKILFEKEWDGTGWKTIKPPTIQDTVKILQENLVDIKDDRKGLVKISVEHKNAEVAAAIANEYTTALQRFLNSNSMSMAKRNRIFLEKQLEMTKAELRNAEESLRNYQTRKKVVAIDTQAEGAIRAFADLKAMIVSREVQLAAMHEFATAAHPDIRRTEDELRELRNQLKRLDVGPNKPASGESNGALITLQDAPTVGLNYVRLKRDVLIQEKVFEVLTQQYELAKIEEAKDEITFSIASQYHSRPKKIFNVVLAGGVSLFVGILLVFLLEFNHRKKARIGIDPTVSSTKPLVRL